MNLEIKSRIVSDGKIIYERVSIFEEPRAETELFEKSIQFGEYYLTRITAIPMTFVAISS